MEKKGIKNEDLVREIFVSLGWNGRIRNLTTEEKKELDIFLKTGVSRYSVNLGWGKVFVDPVFGMRVERAVERYGHIVYDIINDIYFGFPEDGLNEPVDDFFKD